MDRLSGPLTIPGHPPRLEHLWIPPVPEQFVHLHLHTQYSLLDGANQLDPLVRQIRDFRQPAVAITDHGNMFGAIEFYRKAKDAGIKPIIGCEAYMA
ncbi:MAG: PHP domain-containing protein, partial [Nitrospirae bacterium]|nr:PHP domain-containing protein [Nitrospirota bacterium]